MSKDSPNQGGRTKAKDASMPFFDHLDELRRRVVNSLLIFMGAFILCFALIKEWVMDFLSAPLFRTLEEVGIEQKLYFTSLFENFLTHLKISAVSAVFFCLPVFFYQFWAFIAPGLYPRERKYVLPFVMSGTTFFVGGAAFAYYILFPTAFKFFVEFGFDTDTPLLTIASYYTTCLKLLLLFGIAFQLPVMVVFLGFLGVIDAAFLRKHRSPAIIGITVLCGMFAPPDALSMIILMIPLFLMYEGSIWVVQWLGSKRREERNAEAEQLEDDSGDGDDDGGGDPPPASDPSDSSPEPAPPPSGGPSGSQPYGEDAAKRRHSPLAGESKGSSRDSGSRDPRSKDD